MWLQVAAACVVAVITLTVYSYLKPPEKMHSTYTKPGWKVVYCLRYAWWVVVVWHHQYLRRRRLNNYHSDGRYYRYKGLQPTPEEEALEAPVRLTTDRHEDSVVVWGTESSGRAVYARVTRLSGSRVSVVLVVRDGDGAVYTLPNQPDTTAWHCEGGSWRGAGLLLECVQPMRTWRLQFNGVLRKGPRPQYHTVPCPEDDLDVAEARLDLVWRALAAPVDLFRDSSPFLLAESLATEHDADLRYFTSLDRDAYDQQGVLAGSVSLNIPRVERSISPQQGKTPFWYLRGIRQRRWGMSEAATNLHRSVDLMTYLDTGDFLYLHAFCYPASLTHCTFGYLRTAGGQLHPLTSSSFHLSDVGEDGEMPSHVLFTCEAGGRRVLVCGLPAAPHVLLHTGDPWTLRHRLAFSDTCVNDARGGGVVVFTQSFKDLCPVPEHEEIHTKEDLSEGDLKGPVAGSSAPVVVAGTLAPVVASLGDRRCRDPLLAGGKGAGLAVMSALLQEECPEPFSVPPGIAVTSEAWRRQVLQQPAVVAALSALERAVGSANEGSIRNACTKAEELFRATPVCEEVVEAVTEALQELCDERVPQRRFAVRSSSPDEDGGEVSVAGQHVTVLGCGGVEGVLGALPRCWASLLSYTSVEYRRQHGLPPVGEMAVVIQEMVAAEVAGVIFTRHPTTGSPACITITANYGLGESVASGSSDPDTVEVRRTWRDVLTVGTSNVGGKETRLDVGDEGGTVARPVSAPERLVCSVSPALALRLARVALHLERVFRSPRDVEFAVVGDRIYLLQARPITTLGGWGDLELRLELDDPLLTTEELLTRANTGEVFPGACTPLTLSVVPKAVDLGLQLMMAKRSWRTAGLRRRVQPVTNMSMKVSHLHLFLDLLGTLYRSVEPTVSATMGAVDLGLFGHPVTQQRYLDRAVRRYGANTWGDRWWVTGLGVMDMLLNGRRVRQAKEAFERYSISSGRAEGARALYEEICRRAPDLVEISALHGTVSATSSFTNVVALVMLTEDSQSIGESQVADLAALLSSCCGGRDSAGVPTALADLAAVLREDEECGEFLGLPSEEGGVWLRSHPGLVGETYQCFLDQHGHRCIREFELQSHSWGMDSRSLVSTLQRMASGPSKPPTQGRTRPKVKHVVDNLRTPLKPGTKRALRFLLPLCRVAVERRETTKSLAIRAVDAFRRAYRTLGVLLVSEGRLPHPELVFFLQHYEIGALLQRRSPALIAKAVRRRRLVEKLDKIELPEISEGLPEPLDVESPELLPHEGGRQGSVVVRGTPVCLGTARGPARVVTDLAEAASIRSGDVLVTYSTDVGWTPYFPLLAGVVTEIGGLISHGAVVAREYGLPCVVGARGVTRALRSGDIVELDGNTGIITVV